MFFLTDSILLSLDYVTSGLVVFPAMIHTQLMHELPFLATEHIIISLVNKHGVSRQEAHEQIRVLAGEAAANVKLEGGVNDLTERIKRTEFFVSFSIYLRFFGLSTPLRPPLRLWRN